MGDVMPALDRPSLYVNPSSNEGKSCPGAPARDARSKLMAWPVSGTTSRSASIYNRVKFLGVVYTLYQRIFVFPVPSIGKH